MKTKWWHVLFALVGISLFMMFVVPPSTRCKFYFWNKNACTQQEGAAKLLGADPGLPLFIQGQQIRERIGQLT